MTKEGKEFIEGLNLYLLSLGKSDNERMEFIEEAEEHLRLGEEEGKTVRDIFGDSPEEYAKSVADEMSFSKKEIVNSIGMLIFGIFMWVFFSKIEGAAVHFSKMEVMYSPVIYAVTFIILFIISRKFAFKDKKLTIALFILFTCNIGALVVVGLFAKDQPYFLSFDRTITNIIILVCFVITLILCIKIKSYIMLLVFIMEAPQLIGCLINVNLANMKTYFDILVAILALIFIKFEYKRELKEE